MSSLEGHFKKTKSFSSLRHIYAFMKLFTINGAYSKVIGKQISENGVLLNTG